MGRRRGRTAAAVTVVLGIVLAATGCGDRGAAAPGGPGGDPAAQVRATADVLERSGTSRARTAMEMASGGTRLTIRGSGSFDYRARIGELTVTLPDSGQKPVTEVIRPGTLYMKNRGAGVPEDKWVRVDTTALSDGNLVTGGVTDPFAAAELLRGADKVSYVGSTELGGADVRHYRGTSDLAVAARQARPPMQGQLAAAAKGFSRTAVPFDVYLDGQGRLRKVRHEFVFDNSEGQGVKVASTTSLFGFGAPVRVQMPSAEEIYTGRIAAPGQ